MSYIFFIRNSGERKGKYRFFKTQLFPAYASEANLKIAEGILGTKETGKTTYMHLSGGVLSGGAIDIIGPKLIVNYMILSAL